MTALMTTARTDQDRAGDAIGPGGALTGPVIGRRRLGGELRRLREARCLRLEDVTGDLGIACSTLSRIETGRAPARTCYVSALLARYGVTDPEIVRRLTDLAREGQRREWHAGYAAVLPAGAGRYLGLESAATQISVLAVQTVPSLLRTASYAAAAARLTRPDLTPAQSDLLAAARRQRHQALRDGHRLHVVIDESALTRAIAPPPVLAGQLRHLAATAAGPHVTVQILPLAARRDVLAGPLTLLGFPDPEDPDLACRRGADGRVVITSQPAVVASLCAAFRSLAAAALDPQQSADLITTLAGQR